MRKQILHIAFCLVFLSCLTFSCSKKGIGDVDEFRSPIVTVLENTLYQSDISEMTYYGMSAEDSTRIVDAYIKTWVNDNLIYENAKKNIPNKQKIEELVEDYRKSLIINEYQTLLLKERLSKTATEQELISFYNQNKERFNLDEHIIKGLYLKVPKTSLQLDNFKKWYKQDTDAAKVDIEKNALQSAVGYEDFYEKWVSLHDVLENIPNTLTDGEDFLKKNKNVEVQDSLFVYLLNIKEYKLANAEAPYEYIKDQVKTAYMEEKRQEFIRELQNDLYNEALSNEQIKYYIK